MQIVLSQFFGWVEFFHHFHFPVLILETSKLRPPFARDSTSCSVRESKLYVCSVERCGEERWCGAIHSCSVVLPSGVCWGVVYTERSYRGIVYRCSYWNWSVVSSCDVVLRKNRVLNCDELWWHRVAGVLCRVLSTRIEELLVSLCLLKTLKWDDKYHFVKECSMFR